MPPKSRSKNAAPIIRYEPVRLDALFEVLDAVAWLPNPTAREIAQFANIDPRTAGKLLKNARLVGLVESPDDETYISSAPYPFKGTTAQKEGVVREAILRLPLIQQIKQFVGLGNDLKASMRKAATIAGERNYVAANITPLIALADRFGALELQVRVETIINSAVEAKIERHTSSADKRVAFISHSSKDKPFVRQLAADLVASGVQVWLDEQRIRVGDSIADSIAQGVAESDFFLLVVSTASIESPWVKKELNQALVHEIEKRRVTVMPVLLNKVERPASISDKKYADFTESYSRGLQELLLSIKARGVASNGE
ncbi:MAG: toll/interleukin-1 receptor domain-containing protein [Terracidiphilus sp.]|nr:toll/interleukin-1 receptor domain-containing protein [Terracidiphilus sp.]